MRTVSVQLEVPEGMVPYMRGDSSIPTLGRDALLLYPFIRNLTISHGRAAEILGIRKTDLIELYDSMGIPYLDQTPDELREDLATLDRVLGAVR